MNKLEEYEKARDEIKSKLSAVNKLIKDQRAIEVKKTKNLKLQDKYDAICERERKLKTQNMLLMGMLAKYLNEDKGMTIKDTAEVFGLSPVTVRQKIRRLERSVEAIKDGRYKEECFNE
jgi:predicted DNA binding protein